MYKKIVQFQWVLTNNIFYSLFKARPVMNVCNADISDGCPDDCNNNGVCVITDSGWKCKCRDSWKGEACDMQMETSCQDHFDNDNGKIVVVVAVNTVGSYKPY